MTTSHPEPDDGAPQLRMLFLWRILLYFQIVSAGFWWWLSPGGFPAAHPRFFVNRVLPWLAAFSAGVCLYLESQRQWQKLRYAAVAPIAFVFASTVTAAVLFPQSSPRLLAVRLPGLIVLAAVCLRTFGGIRQFRRPAVPVGIFAACLGVGATLAERGDNPDTAPLNFAATEHGTEQTFEPTTPMVTLGEHVLVQTAEGRVRISGSLKIDVAPLLTFVSRSPDRFWTIFASKRDRVGPDRTCDGMISAADAVFLHFRDDAESFLKVVANPKNQGVEIEAQSRLDRPVYSHLNSFAEFEIRGHSQLSLSFSPCPDVRVEVTPFDYPIGRPLRLAYLDANDVFHIVEARSGEKGPFTEFGRGMLRRSDPLIITIHDEENVRAQITLDDWASQCGRVLSPTAGWGLPVNAIEFSRLGQAAESPVKIWITLAGTSVGRGWDSVGHAAGSYRNRMRVTSNDELRALPP